MKKDIIFLQPVFKEMIWGGNRLRTDFNYLHTESMTMTVFRTESRVSFM